MCFIIRISSFGFVSSFVIRNSKLFEKQNRETRFRFVSRLKNRSLVLLVHVVLA